MNKISNIYASKILDSRGEWTLRTHVFLDDGIAGIGEVPSGISKGLYEAALLPVEEAIANVNEKITPKIKGLAAKNQEKIDQVLIELDGTENKSNLGANAILSVSLAICDAAAKSQHCPLYKYIRSVYQLQTTNYQLPAPMLLMLEGGVHAKSARDFQEYMICPRRKTPPRKAGEENPRQGKPSRFKNPNLEGLGIGAVGESPAAEVSNPFAARLEVGTKIYHSLKEVLDRQAFSTAVGVEGGFWPQKLDTIQAFSALEEAISIARAAEDEVEICLDIAANSFARGGAYQLSGIGQVKSSSELLTFYKDLKNQFPSLFSLEDPFSETDLESWKEIRKELGATKIVADDLTVTNPKKLKPLIGEDLFNAVIVKPNQVGTLSETLDFARLAKENDLELVVSHRAGETNSSFIADLAVGIGAEYVKFGAPARGERVAKYNRLLEIEREIR